MKLHFSFMLLTFVNTAALAFSSHTASYQLAINGVTVAEEIRTLHQLDDNFFYTANAKTTGLAALVKDYSIAASSTFSINTNGVNGINYQIMELEDEQVRENNAIDIYPDNGRVISILTKTQPKVKTWEAKAGNIVDPLNLFLAIALDLKNTPKKTVFQYQVANGTSIEQQDFQTLGAHTISIQGKTHEAVKVKRIGRQDNPLEAYFLPDYQYLPILIKQTRHGRKYTYEITSIKMEADKKL